MKYELSKFFDSIIDPRRKQGQRHSFENILTIIIMAILSGHQGVRGFSRFAKSNSDELTEVLGLKHGVPGYSTFQTMLLDLDSQLLSEQFIAWVRDMFPDASDDFVALDGKSIKASSSGGNTKMQNFVSVVSAFGQKSGLVYGMASFESGKSGEPEAVRELVGKLGIRDVVFTMDALHSKKNT